MKIVLDTNRYRDADDGLADVIQMLMLVEQIGVPTISLGELRAGFLNGNRQEENER